MFHRKLENRIEQLEADMKWWRERYCALEGAYNELFDFLAPELGFAAEEGIVYPTNYYYGNVKLAPRRLKKTTPVPEIERTKKGK